MGFLRRKTSASQAAGNQRRFASSGRGRWGRGWKVIAALGVVVLVAWAAGGSVTLRQTNRVFTDAKAAKQMQTQQPAQQAQQQQQQQQSQRRPSMIAAALAAVQRATISAASAVGLSGDIGSSSGRRKSVGTDSRPLTWADSLPNGGWPPDDSDDSSNSSYAGLPCVESGYCSVGRMPAPYVGEVDSTEGLRAALKAASYKREVVMITIGDNSHVLGMSLVVQMWRLGLANALLLGKEEASCTKIQSVYKNVTCVWSTAKWWPRQVGLTTDIWTRRVLLFARMVWHGFNVWNLDADAYFYHDPYKYTKSPPFREFTHLALQDGGMVLNGGTNYIQNARLDGAEAWFIAATAERILTVNEHWDWALKECSEPCHIKEGDLGAAMADQEVYSDIMASTKIGFPVLRYAARNFYSSEQHSKIDQLVDYGRSRAPLQYPPDWKWITHTEAESVPAANMSIPWVGNSWNELSWRRWPQGNASSFFIKQLEEESGARFWNITGPQAPAQVANGSFMFLPSWFVQTWLGRGVDGYWDLEPPQQVMVHCVFMGAGDATLSHKKEYALKVHRAYHYSAAEAMADGQIIPAMAEGHKYPKVLALAPGVRILTQREDQFRAAIAQLIRLATRMGRIMLVPEPFCGSPWIGGHGVRQLEGHTHGKWNGDRVLHYGIDDGRHCLWWPVVDKVCHPGAYTVQPDFEALLTKLPPEAAKPTAQNTLYHEFYAAALAASANEAVRGLEIVQPGAAVLEAAKAFDSQPVLYIGAALRLLPDLPEGSEQEEAAFKAFKERCRWMGPKFMNYCNGTATIGATHCCCKDA